LGFPETAEVAATSRCHRHEADKIAIIIVSEGRVSNRIAGRLAIPAPPRERAKRPVMRCNGRPSLASG
jgi:hypothetical protein